MGVYPTTISTKEELAEMMSDESVKERIMKIPEKTYGDNSTYELQIMVTFISVNMSYNYSISYHGINHTNGKIDTLFYVGPESSIVETMDKVEKELEDVDY